MKKTIGFAIAVIALVAGAWYFFFKAEIPETWTLDSSASTFEFSSTKNGDITETHSITQMTGQASVLTGRFEVELDLASLETNIDIRNERMRDFLFEVDRYPTASITGTFALTDVANIGVGETGILETDVTLNLHGAERVIPMRVSITHNEWGRVTIRPANQVVIQASDFNLLNGLETLRGLANLDSLSPDVPIDFTLVFISRNDV